MLHGIHNHASPSASTCSHVRLAARTMSCTLAAMVIDRRTTHVGIVVMSPKTEADLRRNRDCLDRAPEVLPIENACAD
eukprot:5929359-Pleurochrysis_carterae.AAC.1